MKASRATTAPASVSRPKRLAITAPAEPYYYDRAEIELDLARRAAHPAAVRAHYLLAGFYLDRFYSGQRFDEGDPLSTVLDSDRLPGEKRS